MRVILLLIACGRFSKTCVEIASLNYLSIIAILSLSLPRKQWMQHDSTLWRLCKWFFRGCFSIFLFHYSSTWLYVAVCTLLVFVILEIKYQLLSHLIVLLNDQHHTKYCLTNLLTILNVLLWLMRLNLVVDIVAFCVWLTLTKFANWFISPCIWGELNKRNLIYFPFYALPPCAANLP